jgi:hypothetical protein
MLRTHQVKTMKSANTGDEIANTTQELRDKNI